MKALLNNDPQVGDIVAWMSYSAGDEPPLQLAFENPQEYYARHLMARPSLLVRWALKLWWRDFFRRVKHGKQPKPSYSTVAEELRR